MFLYFGRIGEEWKEDAEYLDKIKTFVPMDQVSVFTFDTLFQVHMDKVVREFEEKRRKEFGKVSSPRDFAFGSREARRLRIPKPSLFRSKSYRRFITKKLLKGGKSFFTTLGVDFVTNWIYSKVEALIDGKPNHGFFNSSNLTRVYSLFQILITTPK